MIQYYTNMCIYEIGMKEAPESAEQLKDQLLTPFYFNFEAVTNRI